MVGFGLIGLALSNTGGASVGVFIGAGVLIVLDADGTLNQDALVKEFEKAYPFIDNNEVFDGLATAIKAKSPEQFVVGQKYFVSLSESETRSILSSSAVSEENVMKVVNDLK